jgi:aspartate carbamoyltransferase catalytic subunit
MELKHLVNSMDIDKKGYDEIVRRGIKFINEGMSGDVLKNKIVSTLFFPPSTRTMTSFQSAAIRGGGGWIGVSGTSGLSMEKGESLEATIETFSDMSDCIVLRHVDDDSAERAAKVARVPVINAGSGSREHAVAAAMMLVLLAKYMKQPLQDAKIGVYGTPQINRCMKALAPIFGLYNVDLYIDDLGHFPLPDDVEKVTRENGIKGITYGKLDEFIGEVDTLLVTRALQTGIIPEDKFPKEKQDEIMKNFVPLNIDQVRKMKEDATVFMLKPLIFEVDKSVDGDPRAAYTKPEPWTEIALAVMTYLLGIKID